VELRQLQAFVVAAESGSFSAAARRLGVSQPSLSTRIARLEESLGVALFDRMGAAVALTTAGRALLGDARVLLARSDAARAAVRAASCNTSSTISVGSIRSIASFILPQALQKLHSEQPNSSVRIVEGSTQDLIEAVIEGSIDLAIVVDLMNDDRIIAQPLGTESLLLAVPLANSHETASDLLTREGLERVGAIVIDDADGPPLTLWQYCQQHGVIPRVRCPWSSISTALALVAQGVGMAVVPGSARTINLPGVALLSMGSTAPRRELCIVWNVARERSPLARHMVTLLTQHVRLMQEADPEHRTD
jgi:DNA-binding transcriptional LysR family regulator